MEEVLTWQEFCNMDYAWKKQMLKYIKNAIMVSSKLLTFRDFV